MVAQLFSLLKGTADVVSPTERSDGLNGQIR